MKKRLALILCGLMIWTVFTGCSADEAGLEKKTYTAAGEITELQIDVKDRKISLEPSPDGLVHLTYWESEKEFYEPTESEQTLRLTSGENKRWTDYIGGSASLEARTIRVQIPNSGLAILSLSTTNEDLSVPHLQLADTLTVLVNHGNIRLEGPEVGGAIRLETKNGDISGAIVGSYDDFSITSQVKKGESNLPEKKEGGEKSLTAAVNNGDLEIEFEPAG